MARRRVRSRGKALPKNLRVRRPKDVEDSVRFTIGSNDETFKKITDSDGSHWDVITKSRRLKTAREDLDKFNSNPIRGKAKIAGKTVVKAKWTARPIGTGDKISGYWVKMMVSPFKWETFRMTVAEYQEWLRRCASAEDLNERAVLSEILGVDLVSSSSQAPPSGLL